MPLVAAAVCPHPPLLVPELAGHAAAELDDLRAACAAALDALVETRPDALAIVGSGPVTARFAGRPGGSFAGYGAPQVAVGEGPDAGLPLSLLVAAWLVERSAAAGLPRTSVAVAANAQPGECAELGRKIAGDVRRTAVLVMGDGSARHSEHAPMHLHPRANAFDEVVAEALASADTEALATLDPDLAADLGVAGRAPWQVLAGTVDGGDWRGEVRYAAAPYGVGYFVASWSPA